MIVLPNKCDKCAKNILIKENDSIINSYIGGCSNTQCRKIYYLGNGAIFNLFNKTPICLIKYVIQLNLDHKKNAKQIN